MHTAEMKERHSDSPICDDEMDTSDSDLHSVIYDSIQRPEVVSITDLSAKESPMTAQHTSRVTDTGLCLCLMRELCVNALWFDDSTRTRRIAAMEKTEQRVERVFHKRIATRAEHK